MDRLQGLPLGRKLILGAGALLFVDTFFGWQSVSIFSANAWHGFWGVMLGLMTIALVLWVGAGAFGVALPANVPDVRVTLALGGLIVLFAVIKTLSDSYSAWPSYVGIVLAAGVAYGAWLTFEAEDAPAPAAGADAT